MTNYITSDKKQLLSARPLALVTVKNPRTNVMLSILIVTVMLVIHSGKAYSSTPMIVIPTDNGSTKVEVTVENGMVKDNHFTIDQPQVVTFKMRFLDPTTDKLVQHINYKMTITDTNGNMVYEVHEGHAHTGVNSYSVLFPNTGAFTITLDLQGTGAVMPYDNTYTGIAKSSVAVTPEFPLGIVAIMTAVVGVVVVATRFLGITNPKEYS